MPKNLNGNHFYSTARMIPPGTTGPRVIRIRATSMMLRKCMHDLHVLRPYSLGLHYARQVPHCCPTRFRQGEHRRIVIGITIPIALLQLRCPNGGGTPTTQIKPRSEWYKIHHLDLPQSTFPSSSNKQLHFTQPHSLLTTLFNQPNQQNGLLQDSPHRLRGRLRLRRSPGRCLRWQHQGRHRQQGVPGRLR